MIISISIIVVVIIIFEILYTFSSFLCGRSYGPMRPHLCRRLSVYVVRVLPGGWQSVDFWVGCVTGTVELSENHDLNILGQLDQSFCILATKPLSKSFLAKLCFLGYLCHPVSFFFLCD